MLKIKLLLFLLLSQATFLMGQVTVKQITYRDTTQFFPGKTRCEQLVAQRQRMVVVKNEAWETLRREVDSLNKAGYPCYEYRIQLVEQLGYPGVESTAYRKCLTEGTVPYYFYNVYQSFTLAIIKDEYQKMFRPMYSGEVFCAGDFYRQ